MDVKQRVIAGSEELHYMVIQTALDFLSLFPEVVDLIFKCSLTVLLLLGTIATLRYCTV